MVFFSATIIISCDEDSATKPRTDGLFPYPVNDLTIAQANENSVRLQWTATGDDGYLGTAAQYDIRYAEFPISEENWEDCDSFPGAPAPSEQGELDSITVTGLNTHTYYDFGIKVADETPNWSDLSNVVSGWTDSPSPYQVTDNSEAEFGPAWSKSGRWFAYESGDRDIWMIPSGGGAPIEVVSNAAWDGSPDWSPDGSKIAFMSDRSGNSDIWIVTLGDGSVTRLTTDPDIDTDPEWSPDGSSIAFTSYRGVQGEIWVIPAGGGAATQITNDPTYPSYSPSWSPDGSKLAFIRNYEVWTASSAGGSEIQLTDFPSGWCDDPAWSPDGSSIAFSYSPASGNYDIWTVPAGGGSVTQLTTEPSGDHEPSWRPDGERISFRSYRSGNRDIWTIEVP